MSEHRHLYNSAAWKRAREAQLRAHPLCRMHLELGQTVQASVVDHITPHRGDRGLFADHANMQSLCKSCHDGHKQAQEHSPGGLVRGAGLTGVPLDRAHPWHKTPAGGGEKSSASSPKTGPKTPLAECQNGRGGL